MSASGTAVLDRPVVRRTSASANGSRAWSSVGEVVGVPFPLAPRPQRTVRRPVPSVRHRLVRLALWVAGLVALWVLYRQVSGVQLAPVFAAAQWGWVALAVGFSGLALTGAALNLLGCSPVPLGLARTFAVQVASGFVKLISPSAVGGAALNARYLQQAGTPTPLAIASVGTAQLVQLASTVALLAVLGPLTGTAAVPDAVRGGTGLTVLAAGAGVVVVVAVAAVAWLPKLRARLVGMVRSVVEQVRVADFTGRSAGRRLLLAISGSLLLTAGLVLSLTASVVAMGGTLAPVSIGMAFLLGSAVGSLVPTPGGIGTVEAALVTALVASGQAVAVALPAVLVFRAVTVWLPVPVGWVTFQVLRRQGHL